MAPMKRPARPHPEREGTVSISEAARRLQVTPKLIRRWLGTRKLNFVQIRGELRIPLEELMPLVDQRAAAPRQRTRRVPK